MGDVVILGGWTKLAIPTERVLTGALEAGMSEVVVIGFDKDGDWYFASSKPDSGTVMYHCNKAIYRLIEIEREMRHEQPRQKELHPAGDQEAGSVTQGPWRAPESENSGCETGGGI